MYQLTAEKNPGYTVLRHSGDLQLEDAVMLRAELEKYMQEKGVHKVAIDMSQTQKVDSSGIGALVSAQSVGISHGRSLYLLYPPNHVLDLLKELEIEGFLGIIATEDALSGSVPDFKA